LLVATAGVFVYLWSASHAKKPITNDPYPSQFAPLGPPNPDPPTPPTPPSPPIPSGKQIPWVINPPNLDNNKQLSEHAFYDQARLAHEAYADWHVWIWNPNPAANPTRQIWVIMEQNSQKWCYVMANAGKDIRAKLTCGVRPRLGRCSDCITCTPCW